MMMCNLIKLVFGTFLILTSIGYWIKIESPVNETNNKVNFATSDFSISEAQSRKSNMDLSKLIKYQQSQITLSEREDRIHVIIYIAVILALCRAFPPKSEQNPNEANLIDQESLNINNFAQHQNLMTLVSCTDWCLLLTSRNLMEQQVIRLRIVKLSTWPINIGIGKFPLPSKINWSKLMISSVMYGSDRSFIETNEIVLGEGKGLQEGETVQVSLRGTHNDKIIQWKVGDEVRYKAGVTIKDTENWRWIIQMRGNGDKVQII